MEDLSQMVSRADVLMEQGRYKDAEGILRRILQQDPNNDHTLSMLSVCFLNSGRLDEGIDIIEKAISIDPSEAHYFYLLAFGHYRKNENLEAASNITRAIKLNPYVAGYFGLAAHIYNEEKSYELALAKADEGLALDPENLSCLNARSIALNRLKRTDDAIETLQTAFSHDPNSYITHTTAGFNYLEKGRYRQSEQHFLESLRSSPDNEAAKEGLKEALKSRIPPYRWLLQYSFWLREEGSKYRTIIPIALYIIFRIIIAVFKGNESTTGLAYLFAALYVFIVVLSWTINSIANVFLLFHPIGKHALTHTEKITSLTSVGVMISGIAVIASYYFLTEQENASLFLAGLICISLALPLGRMEYPVDLKNRTRGEWYTLILIATGLITLLTCVLFPDTAVVISVFYLIAFLIYTWVGR